MMEVVEVAGAEMALGAQEKEAEAVTAQEPMEVVVRDSVVRVRAEGGEGLGGGGECKGGDGDGCGGEGGICTHARGGDRPHELCVIGASVCSERPFSRRSEGRPLHFDVNAQN